MGLSLTVLGASGSYPGPGGACSGYLVDDGSTRVWVDAGSGTLANLQRQIDLADLDALVLSHEHPDHWSDLEGFHNVLRFVLHRHDFPVYAPAGLRNHTYDDTEPHVAWQDVGNGDQVDIDSLRFTFSRADHGPETLAMRIDAPGEGKSIGYSADTGPAWSFQALGPPLDLAICEATLPQDMEGDMQHLSARQAGRSAADAGARRLVLTHLWPTLDPQLSQREGSEAFGSPVDVATPDARYDT